MSPAAGSPTAEPQREALAERIRGVLPDDREVREVAMFGGLAFMLESAMVVCAGKPGDLLVRNDPDRYGELLAVAGAREALMGERPMGNGWIRVDPAGLRTPEQLAFWVGVGVDHHARTQG